MSLPYRQRRKLRQLDRALGAADPGLAFNLATFARINAGQIMPAYEQLPSRAGPLRRVTGLRLSRTYRPGPAPLSAGG